MEQPNVHTAMAVVMKTVSSVKKSKVKGLPYEVILESAILGAVRPAMVEAGLTVTPVAVDVVESNGWDTGRAHMMRTVVRVTYRFSHAASDTHHDCVAVGEGIDSSDKSCGKALTYCFKAMLRQAFVLESGHDPDVERPERVSSVCPVKAGAATSAKPAKTADKAAEPANGERNGFVGEIERLIAQTPDPNKILQGILTKRNVGTLGDIEEVDAAELTQKLQAHISKLQLDEVTAKN